MRGHDYAGGGGFFVTLCVADRRPLFGTVINGRMSLNATGRATAACWREIPAHFPMASLDEWIIMRECRNIPPRAVIGALSPGGMLDRLLADLPRDMPIHYLHAKNYSRFT